MSRGNDNRLRQASDKVRSEVKPGFYGEVAVRFKVQDGVIQSGQVEKSTRADRMGRTMIVEKTKLD